MTTKAWAMRTSRDSRAHREFIFGDLLEGRLRQGWSWMPAPFQSVCRLQSRS